MRFDHYTEADWRLFKKLRPVWQENFIHQILEGYKELIDGPECNGEKFWKLEEKIKEDKRKCGVTCIMARSKMAENMIRLILEGVITEEDLEGFSAPMVEHVKRVVKIYQEE
ncbi:hypothetical protein [Acidaminococcus timonensis]|uniref:hypothetical protein n=1 Tax=Acidaminococcus timonensis TaxID=1871002 RepID=UPI0025ED14BA|nr:hypothetical protein [Acidaminococcus timonensis]